MRQDKRRRHRRLQRERRRFPGLRRALSATYAPTLSTSDAQMVAGDTETMSKRCSRPGTRERNTIDRHLLDKIEDIHVNEARGTRKTRSRSTRRPTLSAQLGWVDSERDRTTGSDTYGCEDRSSLAGTTITGSTRRWHLSRRPCNDSRIAGASRS